MNNTPAGDSATARNPSPARSARFVERLRGDTPAVTVELRPPRSGLTRGGAMDMWISLSHATAGLAARDAFLMLTDSAVGREEEENLQHLTANLASAVEPWRVVPFLTCLHPLDYCLRYGDRAHALGVESLTVTGGDAAGVERCVPHGYLLRGQLRARSPGLSLGGWANLHRRLERQLEYVADPKFESDYCLTQVISHHDRRRVERWMEVAARAGLALPTCYGVFYYRNGRREVLERLSRFFPVPAREVEAAFATGITPERHCAETMVALRRLGAPHVYLCNLSTRHAPAEFDRIMSEVATLEEGRP